jgi:hypothetical protein
MAREIGHRYALTLCRRDEDVDALEERVHLTHQQRPDPLRADVLHRGNEPGGAQLIRASVHTLIRQLVDAAASRQLVEHRSGLGIEDGIEGRRWQIGQRDGHERRARLPKRGQRGIEQRLRAAACWRSSPARPPSISRSM